MKVVIIGSGNVATVFGRKILQSGDEIIQVVGRSLEKVAVLASGLKADYTDNLLDTSPIADIYIIAVSDNAVSRVAGQLKLNNKVVVHTAAAVSKNVLAGASENYGVLYPLQTFRKEISTDLVIPVLLDASNDFSRSTITALAAKWAECVLVANDEERLKAHVAAVFVNNFANHLFAVANDFLEDNNLTFNILKPLIKETVLRIEGIRPEQVQTGPAVRRDFGTIEKHKAMLENNPEMLRLYNVLTESIINFTDRSEGE